MRPNPTFVGLRKLNTPSTSLLRTSLLNRFLIVFLLHHEKTSGAQSVAVMSHKSDAIWDTLPFGFCTILDMTTLVHTAA